MRIVWTQNFAIVALVRQRKSTRRPDGTVAAACASVDGGLRAATWTSRRTGLLQWGPESLALSSQGPVLQSSTQRRRVARAGPWLAPTLGRGEPAMGRSPGRANVCGPLQNHALVAPRRGMGGVRVPFPFSDPSALGEKRTSRPRRRQAIVRAQRTTTRMTQGLASRLSGALSLARALLHVLTNHLRQRGWAANARAATQLRETPPPRQPQTC